VTQALATFSNSAMVAATVVYALAFLAHAAEWAAARQGSAPRQVSEPQLVGASAASLPVADTYAVAVPDAEQPDSERVDRFGRSGLALTVLGALIAAVGVICRGLAAGRVPWGSMYEFAITGSLAVAVAYLFLVRRYGIRWLGLLVTGFLTLVLGIAVVVLYRPVAPLVPALHSYWLLIHVSAAAIAGGAFSVGALMSALFLMRSRAEARAAATPGTPVIGWLSRVPTASAIDRIAYRVHAFAFPLWTFAVLAGAIWAQYAWGRFWGWDPKETWAFITWVVYAAYLHARATAGWQGRAAAYVALLGYATFLFNFVGINLFGSGLHSYAGM
jgi:cytochrome c-type biogenesis protein CcsB